MTPLRYLGPRKERPLRRWLAELVLGLPISREESFGEGVLKRAARMVERGAMEIKEVFYTGAGPIDVIVRRRKDEE